jgi:hypothetical protein
VTKVVVLLALGVDVAVPALPHINEQHGVLAIPALSTGNGPLKPDRVQVRQLVLCHPVRLAHAPIQIGELDPVLVNPVGELGELGVPGFHCLGHVRVPVVVLEGNELAKHGVKRTIRAGLILK